MPLRHGWSAIADETDYLALDGRRWDVYLEYGSGVRVPAGPNYRDGDDAVASELARLRDRNAL